MGTHQFKFDTLRKCFEFLKLLNSDYRMVEYVAGELHDRINGFYNGIEPSQIKSALSGFLQQVDAFHTKLVQTYASEMALGRANSLYEEIEEPQQIAVALLQCFPKFLAAMYFLRYKVTMEYTQLGGGGWANDMVGWGGNDIHKYLRERAKNAYYGDIIPGGFGPLEVRYIGGYQWGYDMVKDLDNILSKQNHNFFRDVLATSVLSNTSGAEIPNTANVLALVRSLCLIVDEEDKKDNGRELIKYLNEDLSIHLKSSDKSIYWQYLKEHCAELKSQIHKLFSSEAFSYTGQSMEPRYVQTKEFAKETAKWLRNNLEDVKKNLQKISTGYSHTDGNFYKLGEHFTKNVFPYGFIFGFAPDNAYSKNAGNLLKTWSDAIDKIKVKAEGLEKLEKILNGELPPPSPKPAKLQAGSTVTNNAVVAQRTEGTQQEGKQDEGNQVSKGPSAPSLPSTLRSQGGSAGNPSDRSTGVHGSDIANRQLDQSRIIVSSQGPTVQRSLSAPPGSPVTGGDPGLGGQQHSTQNNQNSSHVLKQTRNANGQQQLPTDSGSNGISDSVGAAGSSKHDAAAQRQKQLADTYEATRRHKSNLMMKYIETGEKRIAAKQDARKKKQIARRQRQEAIDRDKRLVLRRYQDEIINGLEAKAVTYAPPKPNYSGVALLKSHMDSKQPKADAHIDGFVYEPPVPDLPAAPPTTLGHKAQPTNGPIDGKIVSPRKKPISPFNFPYPLPFLWEPLQQRGTGENTYDSKGKLKSMSDSFGVIIEKISQKSKLKTSNNLPIPSEVLTPAAPSHGDVLRGHLDDNKVFDNADPPSQINSHFSKFAKTSGNLSSSLGLHYAKNHFEPVDFTVSATDGITKKNASPTCKNSWYVAFSSSTNPSSILSPLPDSDRLPPPKTVRDMLYWMVGFNEIGYIGFISDYITSILSDCNTDASKISDTIEVTGYPTKLDASMVTQTLTEASLYAANVLYTVKYRDYYTVYNHFNFESEYSKFGYSSDPASLLCQLRDYVYACHHQLEFLKSQCARDKLSGGWMGCQYGSDITSSNSPLQLFLTDSWDSTFETHLFDPCNICLKSRVRMGFRIKDLPKTSQQGSVIFTILSPSCGDDDPLMTLSSYLNCLTRRTPRTTAELVSFFDHFGSGLHKEVIGILSDMGKALSTPHPECPEWDHLGRRDLDAVRGIRVSESPFSKHDNDHAGTLSTVLGCDSVTSNCSKLLSSITHRAYALYSQSFAHTYLSWTVYLVDTLRGSLDRLRYDLRRHNVHKCGSIHHCHDALPYLYFHGFTPPEGTSTSLVKCSQVIAKLEEVVNGGPIAKLITCMDKFLYGVRWPFIYTVIALWSTAFLMFAHTALYRLDVLRIQSHFMRSRGSHVIDVKALLTDGTKMPSLYDIDYFDDEALAHAWNRIY